MLVTVYYTVDEPEFDNYMSIDVEEYYVKNSLPLVAHDCAEQYDNNSNWTDDNNDKEIRLWDLDGNLLGSYIVVREFDPVYLVYENQ